jgi:hypothetical protein
MPGNGKANNEKKTSILTTPGVACIYAETSYLRQSKEFNGLKAGLHDITLVSTCICSI